MTTSKRLEHIPLEMLQFDESNPRIADLLETYSGGVTAEQISLALTPGNSSFNSLKEAIRTNGGIINPIKVNESNDQLLVFEGNTRLAIYQEFLEAEEQGDWSEIACMIYEDLSSIQVDRLRLQDHLIGTREWSPYAKAKYLHHLSTKEGMPLEDLVSFCGGNRNQTIRMIEAYVLMETSFRDAIKNDPNLNEDEDYDTRKYSAFEEFQKPNARLAVTKAGYSELDFSNWVANGKFDRLEHVRSLPRILENRQARKEFLDKGSKAALRFVQVDPADLLKSITVPNLCRALSQAITSDLSLAELNSIKEEHEEIDAIYDALNDLALFVETHLEK